MYIYVIISVLYSLGISPFYHQTLTLKDRIFAQNIYIIYAIFIYNNRLIGLVGRVFANGPRDLGSIPGRVIPKTFKMVLDTSLLNTQQYKVRIKGKVEQSRERSSGLPLHFGVVAIENGAFWSPSTTIANLLIYLFIYRLNSVK